MNDSDSIEHIKEVYARFGSAFYQAQVLEQGIVNALIVVDLIPSRRHLTRSQSEWGMAVDEFMGRHFEHTMGRLLRDLRSVTVIPADLEGLLRDALEKRNWLAHSFFRERAIEFLTSNGREQMLFEVDACRVVFESADEALENIVGPLRRAAGITEEIIEQAKQDLMPTSRP